MQMDVHACLFFTNEVNSTNQITYVCIIKFCTYTFTCTYIYTHTYKYMYIYIYSCVCIRVTYEYM